jgi:hypothetical protein
VGIVDDVLKALDRIDVWKRLQHLPPEVDDLKARIAALEEKLGGKWPGDVCRYCGARSARLEWTGHRKGYIEEVWKCSECGETDWRLTKVR